MSRYLFKQGTPMIHKDMKNIQLHKSLSYTLKQHHGAMAHILEYFKSITLSNCWLECEEVGVPFTAIKNTVKSFQSENNLAYSLYDQLQA